MQTKSSYPSKLPCGGMKFLRSAKRYYRKHEFSSLVKYTSEQMFSNLISLHKNTILGNRVCSITTCLFRLETKQDTTKKYWFSLP